MQAEWIIDRLASRHTPKSTRGDHELNPGFLAEGDLRPAAVLIGLVDRPEGLTILLTQRTENLEHHPGQISFPGGHIEPTDATPTDAALRETHEEIGLEPKHIQVVSVLDTYNTRTGFTITPVVAIAHPPFDLRADPDEVAEIFEVPLDFILDPENHRRESREFSGVTRYFHAIVYEDRYIWGVTAGILINLYESLVNDAAPGA